MPIYEYACRSCGHPFEKLVRGAKPAPVTCESCGSFAVDRLLSLPNVKSAATRAQAMRAAKQRDQAQGQERVQAQIAYEKSHDD